jgi:hypothetical protein
MPLVSDDFGCLGFQEHLEAVHLRQRRLRFVVPTHLFQNIREYKILPRLIGLARDGATLGGNGNVEVILTEIEERDKIKRLHRAEIEPARMAKGILRVFIPT